MRNAITQRLMALILLLLCGSGSNALELVGRLEQGAMVWGKAQAGAQVSLNDKPIKVGDDGLFVFGFGRDALPMATLTVCLAGSCEQQSLKIAQRNYKEQRVNGVPKRTVEPPPEAVLKRIQRESGQIKAARKTDSQRRDFASAFIWPITGPVTGVFGSRRVYNGVPGRPHYGVDVARPTGSTVVAPAAGVVLLVQRDNFYSGGTLIVDHGFGISSTFIHLSKVLVKKGDVIEQGQAIAEVGATGRATGPHLDWRMNWFDVKLDPQLIVPAMP